MWTEKQLQKLVAEGKIRGYKAGAAVKKKAPESQKSFGKEWITVMLATWCDKNKIAMIRELKFHPIRKWRFDWALPDKKIAVEFEGGVHRARGAHKTAKMYTKDADKYNAAAGMGWRVLRFTALNYRNLITELEICMSSST